MSREGFEEGGIVRVIVNETTALGDFAAYDKVVALEYRPPDPAATPVRAYSFQGRSARGYFDERGRQPDGGGWVSPVPGSPITSRFNPKRLHPVLKTVMPHNGTDYGAPTGTPVYAAFRGKVVSVGPAGACGNMVQVAHPGHRDGLLPPLALREGHQGGRQGRHEAARGLRGQHRALHRAASALRREESRQVDRLRDAQGRWVPGPSGR
jgi:hypothetical protein